MPLFRRLSCVRRCANCSQIAISAEQTSVCGDGPRLTVRTGAQFGPLRGNSRTKLQNVVTDCMAYSSRTWLLDMFLDFDCDWFRRNVLGVPRPRKLESGVIVDTGYENTP